MDDDREIETQQFWHAFGARLRDALTPYAEPLWCDEYDLGSEAWTIQRRDRHWLETAIDRAAPIAGPLDVAPLLWLRRYIMGEVERDQQQVRAVQDLVATLALAETGRLGEHYSLPAGKGQAPPADYPPDNECESAIVQALTEHGDLKGEDLAAKAGYEYNSHFKGTAASLHKRKRILNSRGRGYYLPQSQD